MEFQTLIPHLVASLSLLEAQLNEWDKNLLQESLLPSEREELKDLRSVILNMRKTINLFQLSNAKGETLECLRLIQVFYGLLWMSRPSIQKIQEILEKSSGKDFVSRITDSVGFEEIITAREMAH